MQQVLDASVLNGLRCCERTMGVAHERVSMEKKR